MDTLKNKTQKLQHLRLEGLLTINSGSIMYGYPEPHQDRYLSTDRCGPTIKNQYKAYSASQINVYFPSRKHFIKYYSTDPVE